MMQVMQMMQVMMFKRNRTGDVGDDVENTTREANKWCECNVSSWCFGNILRRRFRQKQAAHDFVKIFITTLNTGRKRRQEKYP